MSFDTLGKLLITLFPFMSPFTYEDIVYVDNTLENDLHKSTIMTDWNRSWYYRLPNE